MTPAIVFLGVKWALACVIASGGVSAIWLGYKLFRTKAGRSPERTIVQYGKFKIQTSSVGATLMVTAFGWAWLATKEAPKEFHAAGDKLDITSLTHELPPTGDFLVSIGLGTTPKYLDCHKQEENVVCYSLKPGEKCGTAPTFRNGLARLQVSAVPGAGSVQDAAASNEEKQLRQFLTERHEKDWSLHVMNYIGKDDSGAIRRVVFNGVATDLEKPMCTWLACEGWTFGPCGVVPNLRDDAP
ncbi:MAG: hypothetical protein ABI488_05675 [Polyangiaceae bacterium]